MPYYIFTFKKDDIELELHASNHRFVAYQVEKWLEEVAGISVSEQPKQVAPAVAVEPEKKEESVKVVEQVPVKEEPKVKKSPVKPVEEIAAPVEEVSPLTAEEPLEPAVIFEPPAAEVQESEEAIEEVFEEITENVVEPEPEIELPQPKVEITEPVVLNVTEEEPVQPSMLDEQEVEPAPTQFELENEDKFQKILKEKFSSLNLGDKLGKSKDVVENAVKKEEGFKSFDDLIKVKKPKSMLDYLIATSYFLKNHDLLDRYSLKQINAKAVLYTKKPIDHSVIQDAVSKNFIEVVPDYTGMADVTEYVITAEGEVYLNSL